MLQCKLSINVVAIGTTCNSFYMFYTFSISGKEAARGKSEVGNFFRCLAGGCFVLWEGQKYGKACERERVAFSLLLSLFYSYLPIFFLFFSVDTLSYLCSHTSRPFYPPFLNVGVRLSRSLSSCFVVLPALAVYSSCESVFHVLFF